MNIIQATCVICATILVLADKSPWIWVWFLIYGAVSMINSIAHPGEKRSTMDKWSR